MASFSGASESALRNLIDQHKGAAKKTPSLPTSVKEIKRMLVLDMKVSEKEVQSAMEKQDLIDLFVQYLSEADMKELLKVTRG